MQPQPHRLRQTRCFSNEQHGCALLHRHIRPSTSCSCRYASGSQSRVTTSHERCSRYCTSPRNVQPQQRSRPVRSSPQCSRYHPLPRPRQWRRRHGQLLSGIHKQQRAAGVETGCKDTNMQLRDAGKSSYPNMTTHTANPSPAPHTPSLSFVCDNPWQAWADSLGPSKCDSNPSIGCTGSATIATIVAHIEHIKRVAGVESVGFGADYDGIGVIPSDASSVASYPAVVKVPVPRTLPP